MTASNTPHHTHHTDAVSPALDATQACLTGRTVTGRPFRGCDAVRVVAP